MHSIKKERHCWLNVGKIYEKFKKMKTITSIEVRFTDIDSQNHVNHTAIVEWIAHARVKLIDEKLNQYDHFLWKGKSETEEPELDHVLVNLDANFHKEILYPGTIEVKGNILNVGNKSVTSEFFVYNGDEIVAEAQCTNVFFRIKTNKSAEIPDKLKEILMKKNCCGMPIK